MSHDAHDAHHPLHNMRRGKTFKFDIGDSPNVLEGYVVCGEFESGALGEIFIYVSKHGSTIGGWADAFAITFSGALQWSPEPRETLKWLIVKLVGLRFEPHGMTPDFELPIVTSAIDYIARRLGIEYLDDTGRAHAEELLGFKLTDRVISTQGERTPITPQEAKL